MANENTRFIRAGRYGTKSSNYARVTGNGTRTTPHDIETLDWQGNIILGGGVSCAGNIATSNGGMSCTGDLVAGGSGAVGGRFDAGGAGSFGGNLGVTGNMSATGSGYFDGGITAHSFSQSSSSYATSYLRDVGVRQLEAGTYTGNYNGIVSHKPLVLDGEGTDGDVHISGRFYDADGAIRMAGNYVTNIHLNKYYNVHSPTSMDPIYGWANFMIFTEYEITPTIQPSLGVLPEVCQDLIRLGFYSTTDPDEYDTPFANYIMCASGYSRRGRSNPAKVIVGLYCSNFDTSDHRNDTIKVICYDVVNNTYDVEEWKGYMPQETGFSEGSNTMAIANSYHGLPAPTAST